MSKNRHTFAKRQREIEKKRKAEEKREKRRSKNLDPDGMPEASNDVDESPAVQEDVVLSIFKASGKTDS
jgi:hypothetical protein